MEVGGSAFHCVRSTYLVGSKAEPCQPPLLHTQNNLTSNAIFWAIKEGYKYRTVDATIMQLWACGFNAWGQLHFANEDGESPNSDGKPSVESRYRCPKDLDEFECVLVDSDIEVLKTSPSATLGECFP